MKQIDWRPALALIRALRLDDWLRSYLPIVFTVAIGGTATVAYALAVMGPWYELLIRLGRPS